MVDNGLPTRAPKPHATASGIDIAPWSGRRRAKALERVRAEGRARRSPCVICKQRIDYDLPGEHPDSCSVQHVKSQKHFPHLRWDPRNWAPAHLHCNKSAGAESPIDLGLTEI